ncbi:hypothetical protein REPUB_Repub01dG0124100 [Reevesia pubescens]
MESVKEGVSSDVGVQLANKTVKEGHSNDTFGPWMMVQRKLGRFLGNKASNSGDKGYGNPSNRFELLGDCSIEDGVFSMQILPIEPESIHGSNSAFSEVHGLNKRDVSKSLKQSKDVRNNSVKSILVETNLPNLANKENVANHHNNDLVNSIQVEKNLPKLASNENVAKHRNNDLVKSSGPLPRKTNSFKAHSSKLHENALVITSSKKGVGEPIKMATDLNLAKNNEGIPRSLVTMPSRNAYTGFEPHVDSPDYILLQGIMFIETSSPWKLWLLTQRL